MHKIDNRGSVIVEMTLIMPVIIFTVVFGMFLFLDMINDGIIQGETYSELYTLAIGDSTEVIGNNLLESFNRQIVGINNIPEADIKVDSGVIYAYIDGSNVRGGNIYLYQGRKNKFSREYDLCTDRLRRWQLYGDILRE